MCRLFSTLRGPVLTRREGNLVLLCHLYALLLILSLYITALGGACRAFVVFHVQTMYTHMHTLQTAMPS
jgi:hypothetical protein